MDYTKYIGVTLNFPKKGISFKDISPLLRDKEAFHSCIDDLAKIAEEFKPDIICGPESRAFIFGAALAYKMNTGFVMARKAGKLPGVIYQITYQLEYGTATLSIPKDSFKPGARVLLVDDLMATGGTFAALKELVKMAGGNPVGAVTVIHLKDLDGSDNCGLTCKWLLDL
ncbi:MAG: adenine phosphoribosyltransferase [Bacilli bacterium]|jgi:adenine phosphoribosyltransferase